MAKLHLIMPMGGAGSRFFKEGFVVPKPLIEIAGKPFFYYATRSIEKFVELKDITFVVLKEHIEKYSIDEYILKFFPNAKIVVIPELLNGAVLTCMKGVEWIDDNDPIIFNDCDHAFICKSFYKFDYEKLDGALLTFKSNDPRYSFLEMDKTGNVIHTVEKQAVSDNAICGAYYFKNKDTFLDNAIKYLENCDYSEYFMSGVYNVMVDKNMKIGNFICDIHVSFGTPEEYKKAQGNEIFERLC